MSNTVNQNILEVAKALAEEWTGTNPGDQLTEAINNNDLEQIYRLIKEIKAVEAQEYDHE